jgi:flagellin-specific chaperone FliS
MASPHETTSDSSTTFEPAADGNRSRELMASIPDRYERLIATLAIAERELVTVDEAGRTACLEEASAIVFDLLYSLDFKHGGETVPRLAALYGYVAKELLAIGKSGDREKLAQLRDMITTLMQSWRESPTAA